MRAVRLRVVLAASVLSSVLNLSATTPLQIAQRAYLKASNTDANDTFGWSVAVSGDTVVVGAYDEASNATGVNGNQRNNSALNSGAAYVFVRSGTTWSQQAYLKASNTEASDQFGWSVAVSGDTVVVGAPAESSSATEVNGDQTDNSAYGAGAAYVFVRSGTNWSQQAYLKASNTGAFGSSVAVSGDAVVVGARSEASNATGVNGDQSDHSASYSGAAYVFVRSGTTWSQQAYLKASNTEAFDQFGWSVTVSGDTVVVGAPVEASNATGVNSDQNDNSAPASGAAYIFVRSGTTWSQQAYLKASNTGVDDEFGFSVAASGDTVVVGAYGERSNATGVNGDQSNNSAVDSGAAYVFVRNGTNWTQQAYLKASNTGPAGQNGFNDSFGSSVAVSGDRVVVGAPYEASNATGVNGDQSNNSARYAGAAYVFVRSGTNWSQQAYLKASNTGMNDQFGRSVAVLGDTVVVGAFGEASNATGVNGDQSDNSAGYSGAAYVFHLISTNNPPLALARAFPLAMISPNDTNGVVISPNNADAIVILDGSLSSDVDNDPLEYLWFEQGATAPFAAEIRVTSVLEIGTYAFVLQVSDGLDIGSDTITVEVITAGEAVATLILQVDEADVSGKNKRPLLATLKAAYASFDRDQMQAGANQLHAFQNKVRAQIAPVNERLAEEWIRLAQQIIDAVAE